MFTALAIFLLILTWLGGMSWLIYKTRPKEPPMRCPATDYTERCDISPKDATVKRWGAREWGKYEMWVTCSQCGERFHRFGLKKHELEKAGVDVDEQLEERIF